MLEERRARHERRKQARLKRVDIYVPNEFLVGELTVRTAGFNKEKAAPIFTPYCQKKRVLSLKKRMVFGRSARRKELSFPAGRP